MIEHEIYSKADTHIHTTYSDGTSRPEEVVEYVSNHTDLRVIAITDHNTAEGAFVAREHARRLGLDVDVIIGQEVTTAEGDIVGLYLKDSLPVFDSAKEAIEAIHAQDGLAVAVHPFSYWASLAQMRGVGVRIVELPLDGVEVRNGFPANFVSNALTEWVNRRYGQKLSELGGSDSHVPYTIGQPFTWFAGTCAADLREAIVDSRTLTGGTLWTPVSIARILPIVLKSGLPGTVDKPVSASEEIVS